MLALCHSSRSAAVQARRPVLRRHERCDVNAAFLARGAADRASGL